jgi:Mg-chelatase subunit ChlD
MATKTNNKKEPKKATNTADALSTEIVFVMDKSGSMQSIKDDAIGGFNAFLETQKGLPGKATFTLVEFNQHADIIHNGVDIKDVEEYTNKTYVPDGMTALFDAIGRGISEASVRGEDRKVLVAILTDGHENSSTEFNKNRLSEMINKYTAKGWEFIYLGVGFSQYDAEKIAQSISIDSSNAMGVTRENIRTKAFSSMNSAAASYRSVGNSGEWRSK